MLKPDTLDDLVPVKDCDCVLAYPAIDPGYQTLVSIDEHGNRYEEMRTPLNRVQDAMRMLLDRVRHRPVPPPTLRRLK